ncbi:hypothetical protein C0992_007603 [Termitomyces sp. T32_za158]|nr:hypothetical protein C0992_007603 [Termitomyces sp. T32_za158]
MLGKAPCDLKFVDIGRLRYAQAHETLYEIHRAILLRFQMYQSKDRLVRGQRMNMHSNALIATVSNRLTNGVAKYREIRITLLHLGDALKKTSWESILRELKDEDIVGITAEEDTRSEGLRSVSWIWKLTESDGMDGEGKKEALRIEWCKARARAHRRQEECLLLNEEMHHASNYCLF